MNATELKFNYIQKNQINYFFDRKSMKFFGDTMANYAVSSKTVSIKTYSGNLVECWELLRKRPVNMGLQSPSFFDINTFERILPAS